MAEFYLFKIDDTTRYLFTTTGFNHDPGQKLSELTVFRFYNEETQTVLICHGKRIIAFFSKGDELLELLRGNGATMVESKIMVVQKEGLPGLSSVDGYGFRISTGDSTYYRCTINNSKGKVIVDYPIDKGTVIHDVPLSQKARKFKEQLFESELKLALTAEVTDGEIPVWAQGMVRAKSRERSGNKVKSVLQVVIFIILAIIALMLGLMSP